MNSGPQQGWVDCNYQPPTHPSLGSRSRGARIPDRQVLSDSVFTPFASINMVETAQAVVLGLSTGVSSEGLATALRLHLPTAESLR